MGVGVVGVGEVAVAAAIATAVGGGDPPRGNCRNFRRVLDFQRGGSQSCSSRRRRQKLSAGTLLAGTRWRKSCPVVFYVWLDVSQEPKLGKFGRNLPRLTGLAPQLGRLGRKLAPELDVVAPESAEFVRNWPSSLQNWWPEIGRHRSRIGRGRPNSGEISAELAGVAAI